MYLILRTYVYFDLLRQANQSRGTESSNMGVTT